MKNKLYISVILFFGLATFLSAQDATMYYMKNVPQAYYLNPATQPRVKFHFSIAANNYMSAGFSAVKLGDLVYVPEGSEQPVTLLYSQGTKDEFADKLKKVETAHLHQQTSLLSLGFRINQSHFALDIKLRNEFDGTAPGSMFKIPLELFPDGTEIGISDLGFKYQSFTEIGLNLSRNFGDFMTIGVRPKLYLGFANMQMIGNDSKVLISAEEWLIRTNMDIRAAGPNIPGIELPLDKDGALDLDADINTNIESVTVNEYISAITSNKGFGLDAGIHIRPMQFLELSASLVDFGYINWAGLSHTASLNGEFSFEGYEYSADSSNQFQDYILDTLMNAFSVSGSSNAYKTSLNPKLYYGGHIYLTKKIDVGVLAQTTFYPNKIDQDLYLLANIRLIRGLSLSGGYNIFQRGLGSFSFGWGVKFLGGNSYFILETVPLQFDKVQFGKPLDESYPVIGNQPFVPVPVNLNQFTVRFGANVTLGITDRKKMKEKKIDRPLMNSSDWVL